MKTCKHKNENGNFCSQCGIAIREKCPECGEMEWIGRKICEKNIKEAREAWNAYIDPIQKKSKFRTGIATLSTLVVVITSFVVMIIIPHNFLHYHSPSDWIMFYLAALVMLPTVLGMVFISFVLGKIDAAKERDIEKVRCVFKQESSDYAEILKKAGFLK